MNRWLVVAAISLSGPAAFAADKPGLPPPGFEALPLSERNLAVYDAFWQNLERNHLDRRLLSRAEVRALQEQGRSKAAAAENPEKLYQQVLSDISRQLPVTQVQVAPPPPGRSARDPQPRGGPRMPSREPPERSDALRLSDAGFDVATIHRGSTQVQVVTEVRKDSPAAESGITPGWRVLSAESEFDVLQKTVRFSGAFVPLEPGTALAWEQGRLPDTSSEPAKVVTMNYAHRGLAARAPFESRLLAKGVRYLRFDGFGDDRLMGPVYEALNDTGPEGLIIDLRWNSSGVTEHAQKVAGVLLGDGVTIGYQADAGGAKPIQTTRPRHQFEGPLVLLIGPASGGASEILAAAIKDRGRGKLVGRMTNGSALDITAFALPDGGLMQVPTRDFLTSTRRRLEGVGVRPDIRVLPTLADVRAGRDPTLSLAVRVIGEVSPSPHRNRVRELFPPI